MNKAELLKLLQDEDVAMAIFNIVKTGAIKQRVSPGKNPFNNSAAKEAAKPQAKEEAAQKKLDKEAEKKSSLSPNMIKNLRARVEKAAQEKAVSQAKYEQEKKAKEEAQNNAHAVEEESFSFMDISDSIDQAIAENPVKPNFEDKLAKLRNRVNKDKEAVGTEDKKEDIAVKPKQESDYRLVLKRTCPVCESETRVVKYKSRLPVISRDIDLCIQYQGINPYIYTVMACEHCGYAAEEKKFITKLPNKNREDLMEFLSDGAMVIPFSEERSVEDAVSLTEMAILFCQMTDRSPSRQANLTMRIAWIYRYVQNKEQEKIYLAKAAELYEESLKVERAYAGGLSGNTIVYLLGAINYLIGNYNAATSHLSRIISDQSIRTQEARIYDLAKNLWQDIRALKKSGGLNDE